MSEIDLDRTPEDDEVFGKVVEMLGANRIEVICNDGETRTCRIPGKMRKKDWIRKDDIVLVDPWDWQEEKADVVHRYDSRDKDDIIDSGVLSLEDDE